MAVLLLQRSQRVDQLAAAANRGRTAPLTVVISVFVVQLLLVLGLYIYGVSTSAGAEHATSPGGLLPILVILALNGNRNVLLELEKRSLWDSVFGPPKPTGLVTSLGAFFLIVGLLGLYGSIALTFTKSPPPAPAPQQVVTIQDEWIALIQNEEKRFMTAIQALPEGYSSNEFAHIHLCVSVLDKRTQALRSRTPGDHVMYPIMKDYSKAVGSWRRAADLTISSPTEEETIAELWNSGDRFRASAANAFQTLYPPQQPPPQAPTP